MWKLIVVVAVVAASCSSTAGTTTTSDPVATTPTTTSGSTTTTTSTPAASPGPSGRRGHAMAALGDGRLLVVGGWTVASNARTWLGDSWVYETGTGTWTEVESMPQRAHHALAAGGGQVLLFGGYVGASEVYGDTRVFRDGEWDRLDDSGGPDGRAGAVLTYDNAAESFVLFGGDEEPLDARIAEPETWIFANESWTAVAVEESPAHLTEGHPVLFELALSYDTQSERVILLIGGDETWAFETATGTWEQRSAPDSAADFMIAAAYHAGLDRVIAYGGAPTAATQETWSYDYDSDSWGLIPTATSPGPIADHAMAYDQATNAVYLFGGTDEPLGLGDPETPSAAMWAFDGSDWTLVWQPAD
ncbi:MAG: hypothetical protein HKN93_06710 [Acidimicrobiia bacterium]|nr:hypothetical protein [Acidimicrobiia bacterium]